MSYSIDIKKRAIGLREKGFSLGEISLELKVPKNTLSGWLRDIKLSDEARKRLNKKIKINQIVSAEKKKGKIKHILACFLNKGNELVARIKLTKDFTLLLCSLVYWCEGAKNKYGGMRFTNSDPQLIKTFLLLLRTSFELDEAKFRVCIHLHSYHDKNKQIQFWSKTTHISPKQFIKPFYKLNTGKIIRPGYNGCADIRYHDVMITRQLLMSAKAFLNKYGGVG